MRPFVMSAEVRARVAEVKAYGEAHVVSMHEILRSLGKAANSFALDQNRVVDIPIEFKAVYTLEQQPDPVGLCHHLSLRVMAPGRMPHPAAMQILAKEFGLEIDLLNEKPPENLVNLWVDDHGAVNILMRKI